MEKKERKMGDKLKKIYATCTPPIMHLNAPQKFCISIVFNSSWDGSNTQEKWKTKGSAKFWGGGGQIEFIMGGVQAQQQSEHILYHQSKS